MPLYYRTAGGVTLLQVAGIGPGISTIAALRSLGPAELADGQLRSITDDTGAMFTFEAADGAGVADDGINVVRPNHIVLAQPGRWYRTPRVATSTTYGVASPTHIAKLDALEDGARATEAGTGLERSGSTISFSAANVTKLAGIEAGARATEAGNGLSRSGSTLTVVAEDETIVVSPSGIRANVTSISPATPSSAGSQSAADKTLDDQLRANLVAASVALTDASQSITVAQGRRRTLAAVTADRTITLSTTGATTGDTITVIRSAATQWRARFVNGGAGAGTLLNLCGRGEATFQFDGTNWARVASTRPTATRCINVADFGAVGDGVTDDAAAIQAAITAMTGSAGFDYSFNGAIFFPHAEYAIGTTLTIDGNVFQGLRLFGEVGGTTAIKGTALKWIGAAGGTMVDGPCAHSLRFERLEFNGNQLARQLVWLRYATNQFGTAGAQNIGFSHCAFYQVEDHAEGAAVALGDAAQDQLQTSEIFFYDCSFIGSFDPDYQPSAIVTRTGGNTKNFSVINCKIGGWAYNIDWLNASGTFAIVGGTLGGSRIADVRTSGGVMSIIGTEMELSKKLVTSTSGGKSGSLMLSNLEWNGTTGDDDVVIEYLCGALTIDGCGFINYRGRRSVTFDHTTDTFTAVVHGLANGTRVTLDSTDASLPAGFVLNRDYYLINKTDDTFQLSLSEGGAVVQGSSNGSGLLTSTKTLIKLGDTLDGMLGGSSLHSRGNLFHGAHGHIPVIDGSGNDLLGGIEDNSPTSYAQNASPNIFSRGDYGGVTGNLEKFSPVDGVAPTIASTIANQGSNGVNFLPVMHTGRPCEVAHCYRLFKEDMALAEATHAWYITLPARSRLVDIQVEVVEAFAGPGIAAAVVEVFKDASGDLLEQTSLTSTGYIGNTDAQLGALLDRAGAIKGGYSPSTSASWSAGIVVTVTGANLNALTTGQAYVHFVTRCLPRPS